MATLLYANVLLVGKTSEGKCTRDDRTKGRRRKGRGGGRRAREKMRVYARVDISAELVLRRSRRAIILYRKSSIGAAIEGLESENGTLK